MQVKRRPGLDERFSIWCINFKSTLLTYFYRDWIQREFLAIEWPFWNTPVTISLRSYFETPPKCLISQVSKCASCFECLSDISNTLNDDPGFTQVRLRIRELFSGDVDFKNRVQMRTQRHTLDTVMFRVYTLNPQVTSGSNKCSRVFRWTS